MLVIVITFLYLQLMPNRLNNCEISCDSRIIEIYHISMSFFTQEIFLLE